jgi:hypothetical protein
MRLFGYVFVAYALVSVLAGCASPYDPDVHATRLQPVAQTDAARPVDLDGDGRDELVRRGHTPQATGPEHQSVLITTLGRRAIAQVNFAGRVLDPSFADLNRDGRLEIVVPVIQQDSLFYSVIGSDGEKKHRLFAVAGAPRREPGGTIRWDPRGVYLQTADLTGDGDAELASFYKTGFARQPRGVWVHTHPEGRRLGKQRIGAMVKGGTLYFGHVDDDARPEWLFGSIATNNGAVGGGMRDDQAYLGAIEVAPTPRLEWTREIGETFSSARLRHGDLDGDGTLEFVALRTPRSGRQAPSPLLQIDPRTGQTLRRFTTDAILQSVRIGTLGPSEQDRIVVHDADGTVRVLDEQFDTVHRRTFEVPIQATQVLPDANGDGRDELIVQTDWGTLWLGPNLSTVAATPEQGRWQVVQAGVNQAPRLAVRHANRGTMTHFQGTSNPWWWIYRYGPAAGLILGVVLVVGGGALGVQRYRQHRLRRAVHDRVMAHADRPWLLMHPLGGIRAASADLRRVLAHGGGTEPDALPSLAALRDAHPDLADYLSRLTTEPAGLEPQTATLDGQPVTLTPTPLDVRRAGYPYWLVWADPARPTDEASYRAWALMAQRVAHDLKNPLTSILLTVQRLQSEYQQRAPETADVLDPYAARIEERVATLRQMASNFMKFVGEDDPAPTRTDLNAFVRDRAAEVEDGLPPDITLKLQLEEALPDVRVDHDQMQSVVDNLVANAVEALPEGGTITLATQALEDAALDAADAPQSYVTLEVLDTGEGMAPETQRRALEPGFTTDQNGTGVGLAIVHKIVRDHGGQVDIESEPGVGTGVAVHIPAET